MGDDNQGRKAREEETRRQHILSVSERLFACQGLHHTSVADIAKEAEFGIGTIYKYFKDKPTLIQSLMENRINAHFRSLEAAVTGEGNPVEKIDRMIEAYFDSVTGDREFFSMYYTHFHPGPKEDPQAGTLNLDFVQKRKLACIEMTTKVFAEGTRTGHFVDVEPDYLAAALLGMLISFFCFAEGKFQGKWDVDGMRSSVKKIFLGSVLANTGTTKDESCKIPEKTDCLVSTGETL